MKKKKAGIVFFVLFITAAVLTVDTQSSSMENWTEIQKIIASDRAELDHFGNSISISGDYAVIGAIGYDSSRGSAYVFKRSGTSWLEEAKLVASDGASGNRFGWSVSIDGNYALIGACSAYSHDFAYIFKRSDSSWTQEAKLVASDGASDDEFSCCVSISGDYAIIGARCDNDNGIGSGSAYIFSPSGANWIEQAKPLASDGAAIDNFGWSVSISENYALIGAYDDDLGFGSTYVFMREGSENQISDTSTKTPGFELILVLFAVALILFWKRRRI